MIRNVRFFSNTRVVKQVVELNGMAEFKKSVLQSKSPALVDFYADWCQPCKAIAPIIDKFSNEDVYTKKNIKFYKVNVDSNEDIVMEYGISAMPTFGFFSNGDISHKVIGASPQKVKESLDQLSQ
ncbi:hypothetical protein LJB42_003441 [Komagataella kurtzmanii]|nr:hypothetical protein LJB42_003441 [Komagataella kurtzmanii]